NLLPNDITGLWGGTFHSVGNRMLRRNAETAGFRAGFSIMDREDQKDMLDSVIVSAGISTKDKRFPKGEVLADIFSFSINTERSIEEVLVEKYPYFLPLQSEIEALQKKYEARKKSANSLDFDDLLVKPLRMLESNEGLAVFYRRQFQFILVDEYQDTNRIQADFIDALAREHQNVMVVGDDAQSILELRDEGVDLNEIAVLYRAHYHSMELQMELTRHGIPFQITSGLRFFEQAHIKDVAAFLKFVVNPRDEVAFKRIARLLPG